MSEYLRLVSQKNGAGAQLVPMKKYPEFVAKLATIASEHNKLPKQKLVCRVKNPQN